MDKYFSKPIWVLGSKIPGVKCFDWVSGQLDNFSDCGTLIIDMRSLTKTELKIIKMDRIREIQKQIQSRFIAGGNVICIVSEPVSETNDELRYMLENNFWSPVNFKSEKVKIGEKFEPVSEFGFQSYLDEIKSWDVSIDSFSHTLAGFFGGAAEIDYSALLKTGNDSLIGAIIFVHSNTKRSGYFALLPKIKDADYAINKLLKIFGVDERTPPPSWTENIQIPGESQIKTSIETIQSEIEKKTISKEEEQKKLERLNKYKKLLYATDKELEHIVIDSLKLLGFSNAREGRSPEKEDALFDFNIDGFDLAVIEIKGLKKGTSIDDFRQLDDWAWDYRKEKNEVKPILIASCFRLEDPSNLQNRMNFEDHRKFFEQHEIAVLPTWTLFKLVEHKLAGNQIDVNQLEVIFSTTNDVLQPEDVIQ